MDYVPCVIGSEISAEAACISNDSVGGGLIIELIRNTSLLGAGNDESSCVKAAEKQNSGFV